MPTVLKTVLENPPKVFKHSGTKLEFISDVQEWHSIIIPYFASDKDLLYIFRRSLDDDKLRGALRGIETWSEFMSKLSELYLPDEASQILNAWAELVEYKRGASESIKMYTQNWDAKKAATTKQNIPIDKKLAGILLLLGANLSDTESTVALGIIKNDYELEVVSKALKAVTTDLDTGSRVEVFAAPSTLHCNFCKKPGHTIDRRWAKRPELKPTKQNKGGQGNGKGGKGKGQKQAKGSAK